MSVVNLSEFVIGNNLTKVIVIDFDIFFLLPQFKLSGTYFYIS